MRCKTTPNAVRTSKGYLVKKNRLRDLGRTFQKNAAIIQTALPKPAIRAVILITIRENIAEIKFWLANPRLSTYARLAQASPTWTT